MKVLIVGIGHLGSWFTEELCLENEVAIYDIDKGKLQHFMNVKRITEFDRIRDFNPDILLNTVSLQKTIEVFKKILPLIPKNCIISDIASVKIGLKEFYLQSGFKFVSSHPMFGPTHPMFRHNFGKERDFSGEFAVIIEESDTKGKEFFKKIYKKLKINIFEYTFERHDKVMAYTLSIPFTSSMVFASVMKKQDTPGTTFNRHLDLAKSVLCEDNYLLSEILFNPHTVRQLELIGSKLAHLTHIIKDKDYDEMELFIKKLQKNII